MNEIKIIATSIFEKSLKRLSKKFPSIKEVYNRVLVELQSPGFGEEIKDHEDYYKVRYSNVDAGKGKSGGFRLIYYWPKEQSIVVLVDIYSKTEQQEVNWNEVTRNMEDIDNGRV